MRKNLVNLRDFEKGIMITSNDIRGRFPALNVRVYDKNLVYLDNAATSQRLDSVIKMWNDVCLESNANLHRAVHHLADKATALYEDTRDKVRQFLNAESREEIIFTSGTTASLNLLAFSFAEAFLNEGDEVIVTEAEHHSNIVPWQMACKRKNAVLKVLPVDDSGHLLVDKLDDLISNKTKILSVTQISNVLGLVNPIKEIVKKCHSRGVPVAVDGAQGVVHSKVDVRDLDCDFYAFSGHKMYAATGTGVLYGKKKYLDMMPPYMGGGEMVGTVSFEETSYAPLPMKFEAGTQNFASIPTLIPSIDFINSLSDNNLYSLELDSVRDYLLEYFLSDSRFHLFGVPRGTNEEKIPLFSFTVEGAHHEDLALILDKMGIATRSGQMCAEPLMDRMGVSGMLRLSFAPYNTMDEARYLVKSLDRAINMLA